MPSYPKVPGFTHTTSRRPIILIDEEFDLEQNGLPIQRALRKIENVTETIALQECVEVPSARLDPNLPAKVVGHYNHGGYLHVFIKP
jgi:hypothetical protein